MITYGSAAGWRALEPARVVFRLTALLGLTALALSLALAWLLVFQRPPDALAQGLAGVGALLPTETRAEPLKVVFDGLQLRDGLYGLGNDRVRIRVTPGLTAEAATALAGDERSLILGLFTDHQAPYPGALSTTLQCPATLLPVEAEPVAGAEYALTLFANERFAFGGCAEDLLKFRATVAAFFGADEGLLLRIEFFEPRGGTDAGRGLRFVRGLRWRER